MEIPDHAICLFRDGSTIIAVCHDFVDPEESPMGRGLSFYDALNDLAWQLKMEGSDVSPDATE
jgi:hypothetical protein